MKQIAILLSMVSLVALISCFESEDFPSVPQIQFESVRYVDDTAGVDSLVLSFSFQDGDGDVGLSAVDILPPFQIYDFVVDAEDDVVTFNQESVQLPLFRAPAFLDESRTACGSLFCYFPPAVGDPVFSETDNRPPYSCLDYEIFSDDEDNSDTLYVVRNEFHSNFHVDFLKKSFNESEFAVIDFQETFNSDDCTLGNFDGRIPFFDPNGNEGVISYAMLSQVFRLTFLDDSIKLRFYIYDRELNKSNTVESNAFVLSQLSN